ncbi:MAG: hypothetical protein EPN84_09565 [Legionella sp.]|nr:MAG: hypothetical protein EPN84_09565 [Legionella sp.]
MANLVRNIKNSDYANHYKVILWADTSKIGEAQRTIIEQQFKKYDLNAADIEIKNYRTVNVPLEDTESIRVNGWVDEFVQAGNQNNKLPYVMASDMFRMYLLMKEYPKANNAVGCYFDCNDVCLLQIPNPSKLREYGVLFNIVKFHFDPSLTNLPDKQSKDTLVNNDLIIVGGKNRELCDRLFSTYYQNLAAVDARMNGFCKSYLDTRNSVQRIDSATTQAMVFGCTHTMTILACVVIDSLAYYYLVDSASGSLNLTEIDGVSSISAKKIKIELLHDRGRTWGQPATDVSSVPQDLSKSMKWQELFRQKRGNLLSCLQQQTQQLNLVHQYIQQHPDQQKVVMSCFKRFQNNPQQFMDTLSKAEASETLLETAIKVKNTELILYLVDRLEVPVDFQGKDGFYPLHLGIMQDLDVKILKFLLPDHPIFMKPVLNSQELGIPSPLELAKKRENPAAVALVLEGQKQLDDYMKTQPAEKNTAQTTSNTQDFKKALAETKANDPAKVDSVDKTQTPGSTN